MHRVAVGQVLLTRARTTCGMPWAARGKFCRSRAPQVLCRLTSERSFLDPGLPGARFGSFTIVQVQHVKDFPVSAKLDTMNIHHHLSRAPQLRSDQLVPVSRPLWKSTLSSAGSWR